jgi:beta-fructofuranosidase
MPPLEHDRIAEEMEVPQVYAIDGHYYLVFCTHDYLLSPSFTSGFPGHGFRSTDYSMVGESPLGPCRIHGIGEIMREAAPPERYASQLVRHDVGWFLLGTVRYSDGRTAISDPAPVVADETGVHVVD